MRNDITYLLVNPFSDPNCGVSSYTKSAAQIISKKYNIEIFSNSKGVPISAFQKTLFDYVDQSFGCNEVLIECPETRSASLLLDRKFNVHIRLHTPLAVCHQAEGKQLDQARFSSELRVISQARHVSAPSYGILTALQDFVDTRNFNVFKNPVDDNILSHTNGFKDIDVLFVGRFQTLKGIQYLGPVLARLPRNIRIEAMGGGNLNLDPAIGANIKCHGFVEGPEKFEIMSRAKCVIVPSLFENCSMVILEAIRSGCKVVAWDVGGNKEFPEEFVKTIEFDNINLFSSAILDVLAEFRNENRDKNFEALDFNDDFAKGIDCIVNSDGKKNKPYKSRFTPNSPYIPRSKSLGPGESVTVDWEAFFSGKKILGLTISNEHIEEMWAPIVQFLGVDYRFVCRRPLGFHSKFEKRYELDANKYSEYDWFKSPQRLFKNIRDFNPHVILFHNGLHPSYQKILQQIRQSFDIPIVYSELGWLPQQGNIYLDRKGVNGSSLIAKSSFEGLVENSALAKQTIRNPRLKKSVLIALQLNNDTNIITQSPTFRSSESFLQYVLSKLDKDIKVFVKPHPLDNDSNRFYAFGRENVEFVEDDVPVSEILENVGHVISINSTVLFEALAYPVNIYSGGYCILDNKELAISFVNSELQLCNTYFGLPERRTVFQRELRKRQVNVSSISDLGTFHEGAGISKGLWPILDAILMSKILPNAVPKIDKKLTDKETIITQKKAPQAAIIEVAKTKTEQIKNRKLRKLISDPQNFFRDMQRPGLRLARNLFPWQ